MNMSAGLWVFIGVVALDVAGLILDLFLANMGQPTISATAWRYPELAIAILTVQGIGWLGLLMHFTRGPS